MSDEQDTPSGDFSGILGGQHKMSRLIDAASSQATHFGARPFGNRDADFASAGLLAEEVGSYKWWEARAMQGDPEARARILDGRASPGKVSLP